MQEMPEYLIPEGILAAQGMLQVSLEIAPISLGRLNTVCDKTSSFLARKGTVNNN
jgi:hypothetical protein